MMTMIVIIMFSIPVIKFLFQKLYNNKAPRLYQLSRWVVAEGFVVKSGFSPTKRTSSYWEAAYRGLQMKSLKR